MLLDTIHRLLWGPAAVFLLCAAGIYLQARLRFFPVLRFGTVLKLTFGRLIKRRDKAVLNSAASKGVSPFAAMSTALGGTIGTGNIAGVATALSMGGAGAIFWMWLSALVGMATKYAEVALAVHYRVPDGQGGYRGGPMYTIIGGLGRRFKLLAVLFCLLCLLASFGIGNMVQVHSVADALAGSFDLPPLGVGAVIAAIMLPVMSGGLKRIGRLTGVFVPVMTLLFLAGSLYVLTRQAGRIPSALSDILRGAFSFRAAGGGVAGFGLSAAMRAGVARGIFTNEAGMGSAPIAHAGAQTASPHEQGCWGVMEVFLDTIVVCTLTALVILTSDVWRGGGRPEGVHLTAAAFTGSMGSFGGPFVAICLTLFAFASIVGWAFYGESCLRFLTGRKAAAPIYRLCFAGLLLVGSVLTLDTVWQVSDVLNGLMMLPNMAAMLLLSGQLSPLLPKAPKSCHRAG